MPTAKIVIEDEVNVRIKGLDPEAIAKAQEALTFWVPGYMHMPAFKLRRWDGKIKLFKASGSTYLNLVDNIVEPLDSLGYDLEIVEDRRITHDLLVDQIDFINDLVVAEYEKDGKPIILWEHQVDGINTAIEHGCGILELATGSGKSLICGVLSKIYSKIGNVVVIVPNIDLVIQTQHWFKQIGIDTGIWYGDVKDRKPVTIATWQSLDHFPELFANVMTVIVDECFTGDTPILTEHGWKPISEINVGEMVVTYNDNNSFELNQVEKLHENITSSEEKLYEMVFDDGTVLKVTGNHKILTERGWIRADELLYSDEVISINKDTLSKSESIYDFIEKDKNNKQTII